MKYVVASLAIMLLPIWTHGYPLSESSMRSYGCKDIIGRTCKSSKTGYCEAVYVATEKATEECKARTVDNIEKVCGSRNAKIFATSKECIGTQAEGPPTIRDLKQKDIDRIYLYSKLHGDLCREVCGPRYDATDVRNFRQTGRKPGLACVDSSTEAKKNGTLLLGDRNRAECSEIHRGVYDWCVGYGKNWNGIDFGPFLQCLGKI